MLLLEISAMFLLIADRRAYIHSGDMSTLGWWMTRISNFLVFFLTLVVLYAFNLYLIDLYTHEGGLAEIPKVGAYLSFLCLLFCVFCLIRGTILALSGKAMRIPFFGKLVIVDFDYFYSLDE